LRRRKKGKGTHNDLSRRKLNHRRHRKVRGPTATWIDGEDEVARIVAAELRHDVDGDLGAVAFEESIDVTAGKSFVTSIGCNAHALAQPVTHNALKVRERESP